MSVDELLPGYIAGELTDAEHAQVQDALTRSSALRTELARFQQLYALLAATAAADVQPSDSLERRIARQIAIRFYVARAANLATDVFGAYGRALVYYLGLR